MENILEDSSFSELDIIHNDEVCPVVSATTQFWEEFKRVMRFYVETDDYFADILSVMLTFILWYFYRLLF